MMDGMAVRRRDSGYALILFLGIAAILILMAAAIALAVSNASSNTARDQRNTKALDVAEAALDVTMEQLASSWPGTPLRAIAPWTESDNTPTDFNLRVLGAAAPTPRSDGLSYVSVRVFDDPSNSASGATQDAGWELGMPNWDENRNGVLYVDSQARIGNRAVRIRASVSAQYYHLPLSRGVAVWADQTISSTGQGNDANVTAEVLYSQSATIHAGTYSPGTGTLWDPALFIFDTSGDNTPPLSQARVEELVQIAKEMHRYFSGTDAEGTMKQQLAGADPGQRAWEGLVVLDYRGFTPIKPVSVDPGAYNCTVNPGNNANGTVKEYLDPGALLILGNDLSLSGNIDYYGLVYVEGSVGADTRASGNPIIHGMLYCVKNPVTGHGGDIDLKGRAWVRFNANAALYLDSLFVTGVHLSDNGWRELHPTTSPSQ
jgi:hypothetical protein